MASGTLYSGLADRLREVIRSGKVKPGSLLGTEHELARKEGISRGSVRKAIDEMIDEGFVERRPGKGVYVRGGNMGCRTVKIIVPSMASEFQAAIARGAQQAAIGAGIQAEISDAGCSLEADIRLVLRSIRDSSSGAIILSAHHPKLREALCECKLSGYPFVIVDDKLDDVNAPSIMSDNYAAGYAVGQKLISLGHRQIAFVGTGLSRALTNRMRFEGLRDAIGDAGIPFARRQILELDPHYDSAQVPTLLATRLMEILKAPNRPTALFFSNDQIAGLGYAVIKNLGLRIPVDVSVVGFDDLSLATMLDPPLSSVRQNIERMGQSAMETLLKNIQNMDAPVEHQVFPAECVWRGSVGPAPR